MLYDKLADQIEAQNFDLRGVYLADFEPEERKRATAFLLPSTEKTGVYRTK